MDKGKLDGKKRTPKGKILNGREACASCGVSWPIEKMNKVTSPDGKVRYVCTRCL